jgi:hypothetical protein
LEIEWELNNKGNPPGLDLIGNTLLASDDILNIYQPFYTFGSEIKLFRMQFELLFMKEGVPVPPAIISLDASVVVDDALFRSDPTSKTNWLTNGGVKTLCTSEWPNSSRVNDHISSRKPGSQTQ